MRRCRPTRSRPAPISRPPPRSPTATAFRSSSTPPSPRRLSCGRWPTAPTSSSTRCPRRPATGGNAIAGGIVARHGLVSRHLDDEPARRLRPVAQALALPRFGPVHDTDDRPLSAQRNAHPADQDGADVEQHHGGRALSRRPPEDRAGRLPRSREPPVARAGLALPESRRRRHARRSAISCHSSFAVSAADARVFFDGLQRTFRATDLGRIKSVATIPAISTHQQQGEEGRKLAGIPPTMVRLCVGAEHPADTIDDLDQALARI